MMLRSTRVPEGATRRRGPHPLTLPFLQRHVAGPGYAHRLRRFTGPRLTRDQTGVVVSVVVHCARSKNATKTATLFAPVRPRHRRLHGQSPYAATLTCPWWYDTALRSAPANRATRAPTHWLLRRTTLRATRIATPRGAIQPRHGQLSASVRGVSHPRRRSSWSWTRQRAWTLTAGGAPAR